MTCLDTTFLIELLRGSVRSRRAYEELKNEVSKERPKDRLCTTIINAYEVEKGAMLTKVPSKNLRLVRELLSELFILGLDFPSIDLSSELYSKLSAKGKMIGEFDILIASICISNGEKLLTDDSDFASIPKLAVAKY